MSESVRSDGATMFANRLQKNRRQLRKWAQRETISCYRIYDADIPEYAVAVDVYHDCHDKQVFWVHVQEYEAPKKIAPEKTQQRLAEVVQVLREDMPVSEERLFVKVRRQQKGRAQYEKLSTRKEFYTVCEGGHQFKVNLADYLDTGLFLDHRITRGMLQQEARGKAFLNLFAYTGSGSVYAAAGGAASTTTIDMSKTYLDWAQRNMELNGFRGPVHEYVQANCIAWLQTAAGKRRYDLIFLDPPSFSSSKRMSSTFDVQRDQVGLLGATVNLLKPGGVLYFSNNLRSFKLDERPLQGLIVKDISRRTLPRDFERNPKIHQCWRIEKPV